MATERGDEHGNEHGDKAYLGGLPHCPRCGLALGVRLLNLPDEDKDDDKHEDEPKTLLLFDCPRDDFHAALTHNDIIAVVTAAVRERLQL